MTSFEHKKRRRQEKKREQRRVCLKGILLLVLIGFFAKPLIQQWSNYQEMSRDLADIQTEIKLVEKETADLKQLYEKRDSLEFVEYMARDKLGMVKADELVVIDERPVEKEEKKEESFFKRMLTPKEEE